MFKRTVLSAFCAAALLVTGVAYAQENATLTLRSGEKVSGQLVDLGGVGYTVRVNGAERQIRAERRRGDRFRRRLDDRRRLGEVHRHLAGRAAQRPDGRRLALRHRRHRPLRLTIKTAQRRARTRLERSRAHRHVAARQRRGRDLGRTRHRRTPAGRRRDHGAGEPAVDLDRHHRQKGQRITFNTTRRSPAERRRQRRRQRLRRKSGRKVANGPLPNGLGGRADRQDRPERRRRSRIGSATSIVAPAAGVLFLGVNDDGFGDNRGNYQVDRHASNSRGPWDMVCGPAAFGRPAFFAYNWDRISPWPNGKTR